jgi:hypothetical protein
MHEEYTVVIEVRTKLTSGMLAVEQVGSLMELGHSFTVHIVMDETAIVGELVVRKHGKTMEVRWLLVQSGSADKSVDITVVGWVIEGEDEVSKVAFKFSVGTELGFNRDSW